VSWLEKPELRRPIQQWRTGNTHKKLIENWALDKKSKFWKKSTPMLAIKWPGRRKNTMPDFRR